MKAKVAFYRADNPNAQWDDKLIAWWTDSKYSHCELVANGIWYSSSPRDGKVRAKEIVPQEGHWDFVEVDIDREWFNIFFKENEGKKYDWLNIFCTQFLPCNLQNPKKWICSEFVGTAIFKKEFKGNPQDLFNKISLFKSNQITI